MEYIILGKSVIIDSMRKPDGTFGSVYEFNGNSTLKEIGLNETFWFKCNYGFSNELPISTNQIEITIPKNDYQRVLSFILEKSIKKGVLIGQFEESDI